MHCNSLKFPLMIGLLGDKVSRNKTLYSPECNVNIIHFMRESIKNGKQVANKMPLKASTNETRAGAHVKRALKRPNPELLALIQIVNLMSSNDIGANFRAMTEEEFRAWLETLSPGFRDHLVWYLDDMQKNSVWANNSTWPTKLLIPFVAEYYQELTIAHDAFYRLLRHKIYSAHGSSFVQSHIPIACHLVVNDGRVDFELSWFGRVIQGAEFDYIRQCEIKTCGRIFYAGRKDQHCCTVQCAKKLRQQKWRSNYGKPKLTTHEEVELNKKKKRAKTARKH